jgi:intein/homing endonuclease
VNNIHRYIIIPLVTFLAVGSVYAATPTPTDSATSSAKIDDLKERLATKVAELRQVTKKAIVGTIKATALSTVTVGTKTSDVKIELTDDISVFQTIKGKRTALTTDDLEKGDYVVVFGEHDATLDLLNAKVIVIQDPLPMRVSGGISAIDTKNFTVTLTASGGQTYIIDIEKNTSMLMRDEENNVVKGGFSKLETGTVAHVVGTAVPKEENRISALRFLDVGNIGGTSPVPTPTGEATESASPTGADEATPTPTAKTTPTE